MKKKLNKVNKIFLRLIILEIIAVIIFSFIKVDYPNPSVLPDFFHPFGTEMAGIVIQVVTSGHSPLLFFSLYALILTVITYIIYLIIKKSKSKR